MQEKMADPEFTNDMQSSCVQQDNIQCKDAYTLIYETFIDKEDGGKERLISCDSFFYTVNT